jgi:hypothetical protein
VLAGLDPDEFPTLTEALGGAQEDASDQPPHFDRLLDALILGVGPSSAGCATSKGCRSSGYLR